MKKLIFTILFSLIFVTQFVSGCTLKPTPLTDFDQSEYIFIGEVTGYTAPLTFNRKQNHTDTQPNYELKFSQANGLVVKVKEFVNLPKTPKSNFEVFPFHIGSICETLGLTKSEIEKYYPLNSEILVIAKEATIFPHILSDGNYRLEEKKGASNFVAINSDENNQKLTSIDTVSDYKTDATNKSYFATRFEMRKDLSRLKNAKTQKAILEISNRILYSYKSYRFVDLYRVFTKYITNPVEAEELYRKHLRFSDFSEKIIQEEIEHRHKLVQNKSLKRKN